MGGSLRKTKKHIQKDDDDEKSTPMTKVLRLIETKTSPICPSRKACSISIQNHTTDGQEFLAVCSFSPKTDLEIDEIYVGYVPHRQQKKDDDDTREIYLLHK